MRDCAIGSAVYEGDGGDGEAFGKVQLVSTGRN